MIIITGGTGRLGAQIVDRLLDRVPADRVGVSVRDPGRAGDLAARGVRVRRGDFTDPQLARRGVRGRDAGAHRLDEPDGRGGDRPARRGDRRRARCRRQDASSTPATRAPPPTRSSHRCSTTPPPSATCRRRGTPFTALRNGFYADTVRLLLGRALETGELVAPADGPVSWTAHADLAEAAAIVARRRRPVRRADPAADRAARTGPRRTSPASSPSSPDAPSAASSPTTPSGRPR